jgi:hypothetical protein
MDERTTLRRYLQTRRFSGRRGLTPMKTKHRKSVPKTRSHRIEKRTDVSVRKHTISCVNRKWKEDNEKEHRKDSEREGDKDGDPGTRKEDKEECSQVEQIGDAEDSTESVHPGPLQAVPGLPQQSADDETPEQTEIEAEELQ